MGSPGEQWSSPSKLGGMSQRFIVGQGCGRSDKVNHRHEIPAVAAAGHCQTSYSTGWRHESWESTYLQSATTP